MASPVLVVAMLMSYLPLGLRDVISLKMAMASPVLVVAMFAFFTTWSLKASAGSAPSSACSVAGMWKRISDKLTGASSFMENSHVCNICDRKFKFKQNLARHQKLVHVGSKNFNCKQC